MLQEAPRFVRDVHTHFADQQAAHTKDIVERLPILQAEWDANLSMLKSWGVIDGLEQAAAAIGNVTGRTAHTTRSERPHLGVSNFDPQYPEIKGLGECEVKLVWCPPGHDSEARVGISVTARGSSEFLVRHMNQNDEPKSDRLQIAEIDQAALDAKLLGAIKTPLRGMR